jgi:hypothetical protein
VDTNVVPLSEGVPNPAKDPYAGNQAIPTLLTGKHAGRLAQLVPSLELKTAQWLSFVAYPLSGGFKRWSLISASVARQLLRVEDRIEALLGPLCAFRLMAVLEKTA